jgi:hypothetical protein
MTAAEQQKLAEAMELWRDAILAADPDFEAEYRRVHIPVVIALAALFAEKDLGVWGGTYAELAEKAGATVADVAETLESLELTGDLVRVGTASYVATAEGDEGEVFAAAHFYDEEPDA